MSTTWTRENLAWAAGHKDKGGRVLKSGQLKFMPFAQLFIHLWATGVWLK